jgi:polar amino acid transport system substrate-binding protein
MLQLPTAVAVHEQCPCTRGPTQVIQGRTAGQRFYLEVKLHTMIKTPAPRSRLGRRIGRKRVIGVATAVSAAVALAGCGGSSGGDSSTKVDSTQKVASIANQVPDKIRKQGYLNVAAESYPTAVIVPPGGGELSGWEPAIAKELGGMMGVDFRFKIVNFDSIIPGLAADRYDIAMGEIAINPDRRKVVTFVTDHASTDSWMVKADSDVQISAQTDVCGHSVAALSGSSNLAYVQSMQPKCSAAGKPPIKIQTYKSQPDVNLALESGRSEIQEASTGSLVPVMKANPGKFKVIGSFNPIITGIALAPNADAPGLSKALSAGINRMIQDGSMKKIMDQWNNGRGVIKQSQVLPKQ